MKKMVLMTALILMTVSSALATETKMVIRGEVASVDTAASTLTVKEKSKDITLTVTDKTLIKEGKEKKTLADIKAGEKITARAEMKDGKTTATSIRIKTAKPAALPKTEAK